MADKNLKNTILLEDQEYNINAVHAIDADSADRSATTETADKVQNTLKIYNSGNYSTDFNGEEEKTIDFVPSDGGKFTGEVHINEGETSVESVDSNAIINFGQIETLVNLLTGSSAFTWSKGSQYSAAIPQLDTIKNNVGQIENLRVVMGTTDHFAAFRNLLGTGSAGLNFELSAGGAEYKVSGTTDALTSAIVIPCVRTEVVSTKTVVKPVTGIGAKAFYGKKFNSIRFSSNITSIANDAFGPAPNATGPDIRNIIFDGTQEEWDNLMESLDTTGDTYKIFESIVGAKNVIITSSIKDYINGPFIYICNDYEGYDYTDRDPRIRQMYLKLPNNPDFIEISTNAIRLTSWDKTAENKWYYTYETLAAAIAGVNSRLVALGGEDFALPNKLEIPDNDELELVLVPSKDNLVLDEDTLKKQNVIVEASAVPSVTDLQNTKQDKILVCTTFNSDVEPIFPNDAAEGTICIVIEPDD